MTFFVKKGKRSSSSQSLIPNISSQEEFTFILKDIDVSKIDKDYSIINDITLSSLSSKGKNETALEKLGISLIKKEPLITIIPKEKTKLMTYIISLPSREENRCFYCRRKFSTPPLGVPIGVFAQAQKFKSDGILCSFNCIYSFISEHPSPLYSKSKYLIPELYKAIFGSYPSTKIKPSPSWRLREEYGGVLTDEEYTKNLQVLTFTDTHQICTGRVFSVIEDR